MQDTLQNGTSVASAMACYLIFVLVTGVVLALVTNAIASMDDRESRKRKNGDREQR